MPDVTLRVTREQLAELRRLAFKELEEWAQVLADQAAEAAQESESYIVSLDARSTYEIGVKDAVRLLDTLGWSTEGDGAALVQSSLDFRARVKELEEVS